jgi:hypothetical protein
VGDQRLEEIQNMHSTTQLSQFDYTYPNYTPYNPNQPPPPPKGSK